MAMEFKEFKDFKEFKEFKDFKRPADKNSGLAEKRA